MAENPGGDRQGVQGGVKLPQGIDTPGVAEFPWGDETPGVATELEVVPGEDRRGWVGDGTPPHHPRNQGVRDQRQRQGEDKRAGDSGAAMPTAGHGSGWIQRGDPAQAYWRHQWRQAQKRHALAPRIRLTGADGAEGQYSCLGEPSKRGRPRGQQGDGLPGLEGYEDRGRNPAARAPSARHARGQKRGAETPRMVSHT